MITVQQAWDSIPRDIALDMAGDIGAALRYGENPMPSREVLTRVLLELIQQARQGDTGPLTDDQKKRLAVLVWRWCADTAEGGITGAIA